MEIDRRTALKRLALIGLAPVLVGHDASADAVEPHEQPSVAFQILTPQQAAAELLRFRTVSYASVHASGRQDQATAWHNIQSAAAGYPANRSSYEGAPGGSVYLSGRMLRPLVQLARDGWRWRVSEFAGGSHSSGSRHYRGTAVDIDIIGDQGVSSSHFSYRRFMNACRAYGAIEVLGPGDAGHSTHVHAAWPD